MNLVFEDYKEIVKKFPNNHIMEVCAKKKSPGIYAISATLFFACFKLQAS